MDKSKLSEPKIAVTYGVIGNTSASKAEIKVRVLWHKRLLI